MTSKYQQDSKNQSGIYKITIGKYFYYGQTTMLSQRKYRHRYSLQRKNHPNKKMQDVYNKHQNYKFEIIGYLGIKWLDFAEQLLIDKYFGTKYCINLAKDVKTPQRGIPLSKETKAKIRAAHLGKKLSEEHKAKISASGKGRVLTRKQIEALRVANKNKIVSDETKTKMSAAAKGRVASKETRQKMSKIQGKRQRSFAKKYYWIHVSGLEEYCAQWELVKKYNFPTHGGVSSVANKKVQQIHGWSIKMSDKERTRLFSKERKKRRPLTKEQCINISEAHKGLYAGNKHPKYDHKIYHWIHKDGREEHLTRYKFYTKYSLSTGNLCNMIAGKAKSVKGWSLK